jgi:hypothetical protein
VLPDEKDFQFKNLKKGAQRGVSQIRKGRPGNMGKLLPIIWTAAFVHNQGLGPRGCQLATQKLERANSGELGKKLGLKAVFVSFCFGGQRWVKASFEIVMSISYKKSIDFCWTKYIL